MNGAPHDPLQVYLPAVDGLIPQKMVKTLRFFLEFCYLVRRDVHTQDSVKQVGQALAAFRENRECFREYGIRPEGFSLPRQHSTNHYEDLIWEFGAPNGLCSSITESKHIQAVKEPWRRSNRYEALGQMLMTNQRLDKLAAARADFAERGMLEGDCLTAMKIAYGMFQVNAIIGVRLTNGNSLRQSTCTLAPQILRTSNPGARRRTEE